MVWTHRYCKRQFPPNPPQEPAMTTTHDLCALLDSNWFHKSSLAKAPGPTTAGTLERSICSGANTMWSISKLFVRRAEATPPPATPVVTSPPTPAAPTPAAPTPLDDLLFGTITGPAGTSVGDAPPPSVQDDPVPQQVSEEVSTTSTQSGPTRDPEFFDASEQFQPAPAKGEVISRAGHAMQVLQELPIIRTVARCARWLMWKPKQDAVLTREGDDMIAGWIDGLDSLVDIDLEKVAVDKRLRRTYVGMVAREVKARDGFGTPAMTVANRLVVQRKVSDIMREHGVRPTHITAIMPQAVALVFIPTEAEIEAQMILASSAAATRRRMAGVWSRREEGFLVRAPEFARA